MGPTGQRPTQAGSRLSARLDPRVGATTASRGASRARTLRVVTAAAQGGAGVTGPEWGRGRAHGVEGTAVTQAGSGDAAASRRRWAAAGGGERRRPCATNEEAGKRRNRKRRARRSSPSEGLSHGSPERVNRGGERRRHGLGWRQWRRETG